MVIRIMLDIRVVIELLIHDNMVVRSIWFNIVLVVGSCLRLNVVIVVVISVVKFV